MARETRQDTARRAAEIGSAFANDLRFSVRSLARARGLAAIVIVLLTLGIGANTATFAVADELFLRPPQGVGRPSDVRRLVLRTNWSVGHVTTIRTELSYAAYRQMRDALATHAVSAGYSRPDSADARLAGTRRSQQVSYITPDFFLGS